jgi:hypothetical protein
MEEADHAGTDDTSGSAGADSRDVQRTVGRHSRLAWASTRPRARTQSRPHAVGRLIPEDPSVPLQGATFADFEDQTQTLAQAALPVVLEERAALEPNAKVETAGRCPFCGSDGVYLEKEATQPEVRSLHGPVVLVKQHARCRSCGGSFSPFCLCVLRTQTGRFEIGDCPRRSR